MFRKAKSIGTESILAVARGKGKEGMENYSIMGTDSPLGAMRIFWK